MVLIHVGKSSCPYLKRLEKEEAINKFKLAHFIYGKDILDIPDVMILHCHVDVLGSFKNLLIRH